MPAKRAAKKAAAKKATRRRSPPSGRGPATPVRVRMYRQGLGDCFLITFDPGGQETHMLVDCGTLGSTTTGVKMADVVADIKTTTGNHLHLLMVTHEHQDHLSGFNSLKEVFSAMQIDAVWLAWTENPDDEDAKRQKAHEGDLGKALSLAANALVNNRAGDPDAIATGQAIRNVLGFIADEQELLKGAWAPTVNEAMHFVRTTLGKEKTRRYLRPGGPAIEDFVPGFRFFVLGPPTNDTLRERMGEDDSEELYHMAPGMAAGLADAAFQAAVLAGNPPGGEVKEAVEAEMPFDKRFQCPEADAVIQYALADYFKTEHAWRQISTDWLQGATDLALQIDNQINNTSLVLAIERISDGRVLLFPADAQEGNWLSWHDLPTPLTYTSGGATHQTTAEELLKKTVFYKVGHHSSHNATAKDKGLVMMKKTEELVAFIPVDRAVALKKGSKGWKMPATALYRALLEQCQGRVARSDIGWATDPGNVSAGDPEEAFRDFLPSSKWTTFQTKQSAAEAAGTVDLTHSLYVDYHLK
ncbi:MAG: hypothetical protein U0984_00340 [Prosthecobacter sp.]|nr:hypothetical protein [Prosthecobacter sp.]